MSRLSRIIAAAGAALALAAPASAHAATTATFSYTGAPQTYTVPAGTTYITATAIGARGGNNTYSPIAGGAQVTANLPVAPGQVLYIFAGGHGVGANNGQSGGWNGGGNGSGYGYGGTGGGASDIRTALGDLNSRILVAGGGGGPGNNQAAAPGGFGGSFGGGNGGNGGGGSYGIGGGGGTDLSGGAGGITFSPFGTPGSAGSFGQGGTAGSDPDAPPALFGEAGAAGGGGGGGWYGGGGGGASAGGGGGSNHVDATAWHVSQGFGPVGDGQVTITAVNDSFTVTPNPYDFGDVSVGSSSEHTFTVTNTGNVAETPTFAGGTGPYGYSTNDADSCSGQALNPGQTCTYTFAFQPQPATYGPEAGTMVIGEAESPRTVTVNLNGTAAPVTPLAADHVYGGQFNQATPAIHIKDADPTATEVRLYVDGTPNGSTTTVNPDGTAVITPQNPVTDGQHTLTFAQTSQGYDSPVGNDATVTVKAAAPTIDWPTDGQVSTNRRPGVAVSGALANLPVNYYIDGQLVASADAGSDGEGGLDSSDMTDLADGQHNVEVSTTDTNGHEGARSAATTFTIDATAPLSPTVTDPADGSVTADNTPDIHVTAEPGVQVRLLIDTDDEGWQTADANGNVTFTLAQPLTDSQHTLTVIARDAGNNDSPDRSSTFTVDTAAPAAPAVTGGPQGTTTDPTATFGFSGEPGSTFECSLDGGAFAPCTSPQTYTSLAAGQHTFRVRQTDTAGHVGATSTQTFTVANGDTGNNDNPTPATPDASNVRLVVAKTGTISHGRVPVGCRLNGGQLARCTVTAYAGKTKVGTGTATFKAGQLGTVNVKLTRRGLELVHRLHGVKLTYRVTAVTAARKTLTAKGSSRVLPLNVAAVPYDGLFASGSSKLNRYGLRFVKSLADQLDGATRVRCTGHTDSVGAAASNQRLGMARAKAVCAQLRNDGVHARRTVRSMGERHPRATNGTAAGRGLNRRVELLVSYR